MEFCNSLVIQDKPSKVTDLLINYRQVKGKKLRITVRVFNNVAKIICIN